MVHFAEKEINSLTFSTLKHVHIRDMFLLRPGKKNFGSGQLIFENWSCVLLIFELQP